ncbi:MAG: GtrA family protein [Halioglobus sp.]|nr:GtrA family protein [Halioglobus sp.]
MASTGSPAARKGAQLGPLALRFGVVGVLNTLVHVCTTVLLVEGLEVHPVPASVAGFVLAVIVSFLLNTFWTFRQADELARRFLRFFVVSVSAMLLNTLIMYVAVEWLHWHYLLGLLVVLLVVPPYNFFLNLLWSYRPR